MNRSRPTALAAAHVLATLASAALLGACTSGPAKGAADGAVDSTPVPAGRAALLDSSWICASLEGAAIPDGAPPTLAFDAGDSPDTLAAGGLAGVNRYGGVVTFDGSNVSFGQLRATRMAGPEDRMAMEQSFLEALQSADSLMLTGDRLELRAGESRLAVFNRMQK